MLFLVLTKWAGRGAAGCAEERQNGGWGGEREEKKQCKHCITQTTTNL